MKQGSASRSGPAGRKVEPRPHAMNVKGVSQIGQSLGNHATDHTSSLNPTETVYAGKGFKAPKAGRTVHHSGSQHRHED